jgi:hypothetical protein
LPKTGTASNWKALNALYYGILRYSLLALSLPFGFGPGAFAFYYFEERGLKLLTVLAAIFALLYFFVAKWFTGRIAQHMAFENRNLYMGIMGAAADTRFHLGFLPFVGSWFMTPPSQEEAEKEEQHPVSPRPGD